jgi:WD40 repeat protein
MLQAGERRLIAIGVPAPDAPQIETSVKLVAGCLATLGYRQDLPELTNLQPGVKDQDPQIDPAVARAYLTNKLSLWAKTISRQDIAILYFAGHGGKIGDRHYLSLPNTDWDRPTATALPSEDLFRVLAESKELKNLLVILDTCNSGQAGLDTQSIVNDLIDNRPDRVFWLLATTRPKAYAQDGEFAVSFDQLVRADRGESIRRYELTTLLEDLKHKLKQSQEASLTQIGAISGELPDFLPNPKFKTEALQGIPIEDRPFFQNDLQQHWKSRAIGSEAIFQSGQWYFTGRTAALRRIISWLNQLISDGRAIAVTGDPGSGKSALLGYLVVASDAEEAQQPALQKFLATMPDGTRPVPGCITFALNLRGKTLSETKEALALRFQGKPDDVLTLFAGRATHTVLVFDSLDESQDPCDIADKLLRPLSGYPHIQVVVGTRRPELKNLGPAFDQLDLDLPEYRSDADIASYVQRLLLAEGEKRNTPYKGEDASQAPAVASAVAARANGNYLVARTIARALMERGSVIDLAHERIPQNIPEAFADYLKQLGERSKLGDSKIRELLLPLAYVYGQGLPVSVWQLFTQTDVRTVLDLAAAFIAEFAEDGGRPVYRLYHQALADALHDPKQDSSRQQRMAQALFNAIPQGDWLRADWFTRKYFANYAAAGDAELLELAMLDVKFLAAANTPRLLAAATNLQSAESKLRLNWLRLTSDRLVDGDDSDRISHLELVAQQNGAADLDAECEKVKIRRKWHPKWTNWSQVSTPHRVLRGHTGGVKAVALSDGIIVSGSDDRTVRFWNAARGEPIGLPGQHDNIVTAVAAQGLLAMSGGWDDTVRFWDLKSGKPECQPLTGHKGRVLAVALGDGFAVSGDSGGTIIRWDLSTYKMVGEPRKSHIGDVNAISIVKGLVVSGGKDGKIEIWDKADDAASKTIQTKWKSTESLTAGNGIIAALGDRTFCCYDLATGRWLSEPIPLEGFVNSFALADQTLVCACGGPDFSVRLLDPKTGKLLRSPLTGHTLFVRSVAVDGDTIVSGADDNSVRIWDRNLTEPLGSLNSKSAGAAKVALAEPFVATANWDKRLQIWNLGDGKLANTSEQFVRLSNSDASPIAAGKNLLAFIADDGSVHLKNLTTQFDTVIRDADGEFSSLAMDDEFLVASGDKGHRLLRWSLNPLRPLDPIIVNQPLYSGLTLNEGVLWARVANTICRWNLNTGEPIGIPVQGVMETAALAVSSSFAVSGHWSGILKVWDKSTVALLRVSDTGKGRSRLTRLALFKDFAISDAPDGAVIVWNLYTLEPYFKIRIGSQVNGIAAYSDGICLACASGVICIELNI